jgi:hypothetical protein
MVIYLRDYLACQRDAVLSVPQRRVAMGGMHERATAVVWTPRPAAPVKPVLLDTDHDADLPEILTTADLDRLYAEASLI